MIRSLKNIGLLLIALSGCGPPVGTNETVISNLLGRWELTGVYKDGIQITDTIGSSILKSIKLDHPIYSHTLITDSGTYVHRYHGDKVSNYKLDIPYITEYLIQPSASASVQYFLGPDGLTAEQKFVMFPDTFQLKNKRGFVLQYGHTDIKILEFTKKYLVLIRNGKELHYVKYENGL